LAVIGKLVSDQSKVLPLLRELGDGCESFITTILKPHVRSFKSLLPLLQSHEERLQLYSIHLK
jgi:hypothetical protein